MGLVNKSNYKIRNVKDSDDKDIMEIYNYYAENEFAVYADHKIESDFILRSKDEALSFYVIEIESKVVGFCRLKTYLPFRNFQKAGLLTYFLLPEYTHKGFGSILYGKLENDARKHDMKTLLVHASSLNNASLQFHRKMGFKECGRFKKIAQKFNKTFDIIWMQKFL